MGDLPRAELMALAERAIETHGGPEHAEVLFKFTCPKCGERCTFDEPNKLWEEGECFACGHTAPVERGGFALRFWPNGRPPKEG